MSRQHKLVLPKAPKKYDQHYENRRNQRIEEALDGKLGVLSPPVFGGVPLGILDGTDAAFDVPKNVETELPFDNISIDNPLLITRPPDPAFDPRFEQVSIITVRLWSTTDHSNRTNELILRVYELSDPSTVLARQEINRPVAQDSPLDFTGITQIGPEIGALGFSLEHNCTSDMIVDMTDSRASWIQLTINPLFVENERYSQVRALNHPQFIPAPMDYKIVAGGVSRFSLLKDYDT